MPRTTKQQRRAKRKARCHRSSQPAPGRSTARRPRARYQREGVVGEYRLRGVIEELVDGYAEMIFIAPLDADRWVLLDISTNAALDPTESIDRLTTPEGHDRARAETTVFGVPWEAVEWDAMWVGDLQTRAVYAFALGLIEQGEAADLFEALEIFRSWPAPDLAVVRDALGFAATFE